MVTSVWSAVAVAMWSRPSEASVAVVAKWVCAGQVGGVAVLASKFYAYHHNMKVTRVYVWVRLWRNRGELQTWWTYPKTSICRIQILSSTAERRYCYSAMSLLQRLTRFTVATVLDFNVWWFLAVHYQSTTVVLDPSRSISIWRLRDAPNAPDCSSFAFGPLMQRICFPFCNLSMVWYFVTLMKLFW